MAEQRIWPANPAPANPDAADASGVGLSLGTVFQVGVGGAIVGAFIRVSDTPPGGVCYLGLYEAVTGTLLAIQVITIGPGGWTRFDFSTPVIVNTAGVYVIYYHQLSSGGAERFAFTANVFASPVVSGDLTGPSSATVAGLGVGLDGNGVFLSTNSIQDPPTGTFNQNSYWVDPIFETELDGRILYVGPSALSHTTRTNSTIPFPDDIEVGDWIGIGLGAVTLGGAAPALDWGGWGVDLVTPIDVASGADNGTWNGRGKVADASDVSTGSVTVTHASAITGAVVVAFRQVDQDTPVDPAATANDGTGTTTTWAGVTTEVAGQTVVLLSTSFDVGAALVPPAGYSHAVDQVVEYAAYRTFAGAGATGDPSHTNRNTGGTPWAAILAALVPETEAPPVEGFQVAWASQANPILGSGAVG